MSAVNLMDCAPAVLETRLSDAGEPAFRARQVLQWVFQHGVTDFAEMSNLGKALRAKLQADYRFPLPTILRTEQSVDGTRKWLLEVAPGNAIETVFIPESGRGTLCISSQVGCALNCRFCATPRQGFNRNLSAAEIIAQVWLANRELGHFRHRRRVITNVVFMGMGEPLLNYDNVLTAIHLLTDHSGFGLAKRKVTVSTSGIVPGIIRLAQDSEVSLALSLHAPADALRDQLVPVNRQYRIAALLAACQYYVSHRPHATFTVEYVMLRGVNDSQEQARSLAVLLHALPVKINLIRFNCFPGCDYRCSAAPVIDSFRDTLIQAGLVTTVRRRRGFDIAAACGQLVGKVQGSARRHRLRIAREVSA